MRNKKTMLSSSFVQIPLRTSTRDELDRLRKVSDGSFDDLVRKLLDLVPKGDDEGSYSDEFRMGLLQSRLDLLKGQTVSHEALRKKLGR